MMNFDHNYCSKTLSKIECCVPGCTEDSLKKYRFPTKTDLLQQWITNIGNPELKHCSLDNVYKKYRLCEKHFAPECLLTDSSRELTPDAIPTLFLPVEQIDKDGGNGIGENGTPNRRTALLITVNDVGEIEIDNLVEELPGESPEEVPKENVLTDEGKKETQEPEPENFSTNVNRICKVCLQQRKLHYLKFLEDTFAAFITNFLEDFLEYNIPECFCDDCLEELKKIQLFMKKCKHAEDILHQMNEEFGKINFYNSIQIEVPEEDDIDSEEDLDNDIDCYCENEASEADPEMSKDFPQLFEIDLENNSASVDLTEPVVENNEANTINEESTTVLNNTNEVHLAISPQNSPLESRFKDAETQTDLITKSLVKDNEKNLKLPTPNVDFTPKSPSEIEECLCERCGRIDTRIEDHKLIYRECTSPIPCTKCDKSFKTYGKLTKHMYKKHRPLFPCQYCSRLFKLKKSLKLHVRKHEMGQFLCTMCDQAYSTETELIEHKIEHKTCKYCGKRFQTQTRKRDHEAVHEKRPNFMRPNSKRRGPVKCVICKIKFAHRDHLAQHMVQHKDGDYECETCSSSFSCQKALELHCDLIHPENKQLFTCEFCSKRFKFQRTLNAHKKRHVKEFPHACSECPKRFAELSELQEHCVLYRHTWPRNESTTLQTILTEKQYMCHVCERGFCKPSARRAHVVYKHGQEEVELLDQIEKEASLNKIDF